MRDVLQVSPSPYEVLGLEMNADNKQVDDAFKRSLRLGSKATQARNQLIRPIERAMVDIFLYHGSALAGLTPNPANEPAALQPENRKHTAEAWEAQLRKKFPDAAGIHALGVFWYWWTLREEERFSRLRNAAGRELGAQGLELPALLAAVRKIENRECEPAQKTCANGSCDWKIYCLNAVLPSEEMWREVIAYWSMVLAWPEFWDAKVTLKGEDLSQLRQRIQAQLTNKLNDLAQLYSELARASEADSAGAKAALSRASIYRQLALQFDVEIKTARLLITANLTDVKARVPCGRESLRKFGLLDSVRAQIEAELRIDPQRHELRKLALALSPAAAVHALLDGRRYEEALAALEALPETDKASPEATQLRGQIYLERGRQHAELNELPAAFEDWRRVMQLNAPGIDLAALRKEIVTVCRRQSAQLADDDHDSRIRIIESGMQVDAQNLSELKNDLADSYWRRGLAAALIVETAYNDGNFSESLAPACDRAMSDTDTAAKLGSPAARTDQSVVHLMAEMVQAMVAQPRPTWELYKQVSVAIKSQQWQEAVRLHRELNAQATKPTPMPLKRSLAEKMRRCHIAFAQKGIDLKDKRADEFASSVNYAQAYGICAKCAQPFLRNTPVYEFSFKRGKVNICNRCRAAFMALVYSSEVLKLMEQSDLVLAEAEQEDPTGSEIIAARKVFNEFLTNNPSFKPKSIEKREARPVLPERLVKPVIQCVIGMLLLNYAAPWLIAKIGWWGFWWIPHYCAAALPAWVAHLKARQPFRYFIAAVIFGPIYVLTLVLFLEDLTPPSKGNTNSSAPVAQTPGKTS